LYEEESEENDHCERNYKNRCSRRHDLESFSSAKHGDRGGYDSVAVEQGSAKKAQENDQPFSRLVRVALLLLQNECNEGKDAAFPAIVSSEDENQILDADNEDERPHNEGQHPIHILRGGVEAVLGLEALPQGVERARPDVAIDDTERNESQLFEATTGGTRLGMV
jgi:hypothetical protein